MTVTIYSKSGNVLPEFSITFTDEQIFEIEEQIIAWVSELNLPLGCGVYHVHIVAEVVEPDD